MRTLKLLILFLTLISCSKYQGLNKRILVEQKNHIKSSPYKDAKLAYSHIKAQYKFRKHILPELLEANLSYLSETDTVYIMEDYSHVCTNCAINRMQILMKDQIIDIQPGPNNNFTIDTVKFKTDSISVNYQLSYAELIEIREMELSKNDWKSNTLQFGANKCFDGSHTFVTAVYPNNRIETIYVRCWNPKFQRN